jgi:hypothetical protein
MLLLAYARLVGVSTDVLIDDKLDLAEEERLELRSVRMKNPRFSRN